MATVNQAVQHEEMVTSVGGLRVFVRSWNPVAPRGVVVICHGFNSHSGYYIWTGERLAAQGWAAYALDLRGRGRSDGERYYIETMSEYVHDLATAVTLTKARHRGLPTFVLGHSAGGVTACLYALEHPQELAGLICESFAFELPAPDIAIAALKGLSHLAPHAHVLKLQNENFSRDPEVVRAMNEDLLIANESQPTLTVAELARADARLRRDFALITLPVLILHGTADNATKPSGSQAFFDAAGSSDKTLKLYDGHVHDLLNDVGREMVLADILGWIDARVPVENETDGNGEAQ